MSELFQPEAQWQRLPRRYQNARRIALASAG